MPKFIAIKTHYDHRESLPSYLKYSKVPTEEEYNEYLELYDEGVGGQGFHECMNFSIPDNGDVKIYLPPTCLPAQSLVDEEFVIFSFTYKQDKELPSVVLGVHAGVVINDLDGIIRTDYQIEGSIEDLLYYASAESDLTTLFTSPLPYDFRDGLYTPIYTAWGYGRRYLEEEHAERIIRSAYDLAVNKLGTSKNAERQVVEREIVVLENIFYRYFSGELKNESNPTISSPVNSRVDKEIGYRGELEVYKRELDYVRSLDLNDNSVEWLSQGAPTSVYDIKSVREKDGKIVDHYIEVKSSKMGFGENVYISSRQVEFFKNNPDCTSLALVNFEGEEVSISYKSFEDVLSEFELTPVKYKLSPR
ncbi:protein NO VEIN domain-containing protein [Moritella sp. 28]|uniref:protein NO VEIN domain-containing protein n=1 Tax=Moritella sp. 28 TaxID=2746232 RepID=UPI001BA6FAE5|nr:DUF3883 domain-containing protein [Moritella sp. 28]QUM85462.1 DUF3883 domain-containing protein [Moritella sp. 28]